LKLSQVRIPLVELWEKLPEENRRQALRVLGRMIVQHRPARTADGQSQPDRKLDRAGHPGKEAGHDNG